VANDYRDLLRVEVSGIAGETGLSGILRNKQTGHEKTGTARMGHKDSVGTMRYWTPDGYIQATGINYVNTAYPAVGNVAEMLDALQVSMTGISSVTGSVGAAGATGIQGFTGISFTGATGIQGFTGISLPGSTGLQTNYLAKSASDGKLINSVVYENTTDTVIADKKLVILSSSVIPGSSDASTRMVIKTDSTTDVHFLADALGANQTIFFGVTGAEYNGSIAYANSTNQMILRAGGIGATVETLYSDRLEIAADVDVYIPDLSRLNFSNSNAAPKSSIYRDTNVLNISNTTDAILISANTTASLKAKTIASMDIDDAGCQFAIIKGEPVGGGSGGKIGFYSHATTALQTVVGAKGGYTGIVNLTTALANLGLIADGTA